MHDVHCCGYVKPLGALDWGKVWYAWPIVCTVYNAHICNHYMHTAGANSLKAFDSFIGLRFRVLNHL